MENSRQKILVTTSSFPINENSNSGGGVFVYNLCRQLSREYEIVVLAPQIKDSKNESYLNGILVNRYSVFGSNKLISNSGIAGALAKNKRYFLFVPFFFISQLFAIKKIVKNYQTSIIHAHWLIPQGLVAVIYKKVFNKKIKILCTSHGSDLNMNFGLIGRILLKFTLKNLDSLTVVSKGLKDKATSLGYSKPIEIIPMGIDTKTFNRIETDFVKKKYNLTGDVLLFVGSYIEVKGIEYLLRAMPIILKTMPNTTLLLVGDGILKERLQKIVEDLQIANNVIFTGFIANDELPHYYSTADVVIMPSLSEGSPVAMAEAFACSSVVIASDIVAFQNHIQNGINGYMVPVKNSEALANKTIEVLEHIGSLHSIRDQARDYSLEHFDWKIVSKKYVDLIKVTSATR